MSAFRAWKTAPVVAGAIYRKEIGELADKEPRYTDAVMGATRQLTTGKWEGELKRYGFASERVVEGTETFAGWTLIARPTKLRNPIASEDRLSEVEAARRALREAEKRLMKGTQVSGVAREG